jgi:hypothetical protein
MRNKAPDSKQWQTFTRLQAAGCPLDWERLPRRRYPLEVRTLTDSPTDIYPMADATGIVLPLTILALRRPFMFHNFELRADWLVQPVFWIRRCAQHAAYCFHQCVYGDQKFDSVLNHYTEGGCLLKPGMKVPGRLVGKFRGRLAETAPSQLPATLWIREESGEEYPFGVSINNTKLPLKPACDASEGNGATQKKTTVPVAAEAASRPSSMMRVIDGCLADMLPASEPRRDEKG